MKIHTEYEGYKNFTVYDDGERWNAAKGTIAEYLKAYFDEDRESEVRIPEDRFDEMLLMDSIVIANIEPISRHGLMERNGDHYEMACPDERLQKYLKTKYGTNECEFFFTKLKSDTGFHDIRVENREDGLAKLIFEL